MSLTFFNPVQERTTIKSQIEDVENQLKTLKKKRRLNSQHVHNFKNNAARFINAPDEVIVRIMRSMKFIDAQQLRQASSRFNDIYVKYNIVETLLQNEYPTLPQHYADDFFRCRMIQEFPDTPADGIEYHSRSFWPPGTYHSCLGTSDVLIPFVREFVWPLRFQRKYGEFDIMYQGMKEKFAIFATEDSGYTFFVVMSSRLWSGIPGSTLHYRKIESTTSLDLKYFAKTLLGRSAGHSEVCEIRWENTVRRITLWTDGHNDISMDDIAPEEFEHLLFL